MVPDSAFLDHIYMGHKQIIVCSKDMLGRGSIPVQISVPITSLLLVETTISAIYCKNDLIHYLS